MTLAYQRILVSGGAGFIGSHIVDRLLNEGVEVIVLDNLSTGKLENITHHQGRKDFQFIQGDIRDFDLVKSALKDVDAVFHEAALVSVTRSVENPSITNEVNVTGTLTLLRACLDCNVRRLVYASSSSVYGETRTLPKHESLAPQPISPYAVSKLAAENYVKVFNKVYGLETICLRYFNVYGPRQTYGPYSGVITIFMNKLLKNQSPIIYGDGKQSRDFTNVRDVVNVNILALEKKNSVGEVFNVATGVATTVNQLAKMLKEVTGKPDIEFLHVNPRPGDIKHSFADTTKIGNTLNYHSEVSLVNGLTELVKCHYSNCRT